MGHGLPYVLNRYIATISRDRVSQWITVKTRPNFAKPYCCAKTLWIRGDSRRFDSNPLRIRFESLWKRDQNSQWIFTARLCHGLWLSQWRYPRLASMPTSLSEFYSPFKQSWCHGIHGSGSRKLRRRSKLVTRKWRVCSGHLLWNSKNSRQERCLGRYL